jgi:excisionase family DNA binding protein
MKLFTVGEVARAVGVAEGTVRHWARTGRLTPTLRVGRQGERLFAEDEVRRLLQQSQSAERQQRARAG